MVEGGKKAHRRAAAAGKAAGRRWLLLWVALIGVASVLAYANAFGNDLVLDDIQVIRDNLRIRSLSDLPTCFTTNYRGIQDDGLYRPVVLVSFAVNYAISGLNTWSYTSVNILIHALVGILLLLLMRSLGAPVAAAGAAGLLFAVHPVHTEAVTSFVGRADSLAALFFLLVLLVHRSVPADPDRATARRFLAWGAFLLALLTKESAITLLGVLLAMDLLVPSRDRFGTPVGWKDRVLRDYLGYGIVAAVYLITRVGVLGSVTLGQPVMPLDNPMADVVTTALGNTYGATAAESLLTPLAALAEYARLLLWPLELSCDYSFNQIPLTSSLLDPRVLVGLAVLVATLTGALALSRRFPVAAFGLFFLCLTFSIVSNFGIKIGTICAERLLYLPSAGLIIVAGIAWERLYRGDKTWRKAFALGLLAVVVLLAGARTVARNPDWRTERSLWAAAVTVAPGSAKVQSNHGNFTLREARALRAEGKIVEASRLLDVAEAHLLQALEIFPDYPEAAVSLADLYTERRDYEKARAYFELAVMIAPDFHRAYTNWAVMEIRQLDEMSREMNALVAQGRHDEAALLRQQATELAARAGDNLDRAARLAPTNAMVYFNRAVLFKNHLGRPRQAAEDFREFLRLRPTYPRRAELEREIARLE